MRVLDESPRVELLDGPTPLVALPRLSAALGGPRIWIKRDDRTALALGGNKLRKLEYLIGAALHEGADTVITLGAAQSNHACQTAAAAARHGLSAVLLLRGDPAAPATGNIVLDRLFGAELRLDPAPPADWGEQVAAELRALGRRPYLIPYGGSNAVGLLGYARAARELVSQCAALDLELDEIVVSASSGGTQAGLTLAGAAGVLETPVLGISVDEPKDALERLVLDHAREAARRYGVAEPIEARVEDRFRGPGYGKCDRETEDAIRLLARTEGILTDPVYTGKALRGLVALTVEGRWGRDDDVLFWHTGGVAALFA